MFIGNEATFQGGGLRPFLSRTTVRDSIFIGNNAEDPTGVERRFGGGIATFLTEETSVVGSVFIGNSAGYGGGVAVFHRADVTDSIFVGNEGRARGGGFFSAARDNTYSGLVFFGNAAQYGGAIFIKDSPADVLRTIAVGNRASIVGGGIMYQNIGGTISDTVIAGNTAPEGGGFATGASDYPADGEATINMDHVTVVANEADVGAGVQLNDIEGVSSGRNLVFNMRNSIVVGNATAGDPLGVQLNSPAAAARVSLAIDSSAVDEGLHDRGAGNLVGLDCIDTEALRTGRFQDQRYEAGTARTSLADGESWTEKTGHDGEYLIVGSQWMPLLTQTAEGPSFPGDLSILGVGLTSEDYRVIDLHPLGSCVAAGLSGVSAQNLLGSERGATPDLGAY
jgi:hypothetical protein